MSEDNKALVRRYFAEAWNHKDPAVRAEYWSHPLVGAGDAIRSAFPDIGVTVEDQIAERDRVVSRLTYRGTHQAAYEGTAATGKRITFTGTSIYRISDGKIAESWLNWDKAGLLQQIGASP